MGQHITYVLERANIRASAFLMRRLADNDMYNHVNNVEYLAMFDSVINTYLIRVRGMLAAAAAWRWRWIADVAQHGGTRPHADVVTGWCVESRCKYYAPVSFPQPVLAGLRVSKVRAALAMRPRARVVASAV